LNNLCIATLQSNVAQLSTFAARNNLLYIEVPVVFLIVGTLAAGLFAGAAIYISAVEHPARVSCGTDLAVREFAPSYKRGAIMQASLALVGCVTGFIGGWQLNDRASILSALILGAVVPFTLIFILPTNKRLLDRALDPHGAEASHLLDRWGRLHAVRSILSAAAFLILVIRLVALAGV
jgi:Anthrone oxygenase